MGGGFCPLQLPCLVQRRHFEQHQQVTEKRKIFISDSDSARGTVILATLMVREVKLLEIQAKLCDAEATGMNNRPRGLTEPTKCPTHRLFAFFFFLTDTTYEKSAGPGTGRRWMGRNTGYEVMSKCQLPCSSRIKVWLSYREHRLVISITAFFPCLIASPSAESQSAVSMAGAASTGCHTPCELRQAPCMGWLSCLCRQSRER